MKEDPDPALLGFLHTSDQSIWFCPNRVDKALSELDIKPIQRELLRELLHAIGNIPPLEE
tara:strand:+ start:101 stop:280 length:180 start_codon:yes stop_codon:yes gene_type:complete